MDENQIYSIENSSKNQQNSNKDKRDNGMKHYYSGLATGFIAALLLVACVYLGSVLVTVFRGNMNPDKYTAVQNTENTNLADKQTTTVTPEMIEKMQVIEKVIDTYFYQENIDRKTLEEGIYKGMVEALGDPYSEYYSKEDLEQLYRDSEGIYYGIGAYVSLDTATGIAKISGIIAHTPAEEADLRENDIIYKVNDEDVYGLTLQETVSLIKGDEGTTVKLTLIRDGEEIVKDVVRRKVESPTVNSEMFDNGMAYIQITEFDTVTVDQFTEALAVAKGSDMKGLILDLRSNPGGNLSAVVDIARMLLPEGMIVYTEDRDGNRDEYTCDGTKQLKVPMVVLVNGNSASASEILAGAIKDYGIGTLLGTVTYGKGIVQRPVELSDGSAVKLTISSYYTPNGVNIHGIGIEPDEVCEFDSERYYSDEKYDNQLERAKELLSTMIQ